LDCVEWIEAQYVPTAKNKPCIDFWEKSGFERTNDLFRWPARRSYPAPDMITVDDHRSRPPFQPADTARS